jgi:miniconductance mechanosensitive channel
MTEHILLNWLLDLGLKKATAQLISFSVYTGFVVTLALVVTWLVHKTVLPVLINLIRRNDLHWDDPLIENKFFHKLTWFVPLLVIHMFKDLLLRDFGVLDAFLTRFLLAGVSLVTTLCLTALLSSINDIYTKIKRMPSVVVRGYTDTARIVIYVLGAIFIVASLTGRSPWGLLSLLGGLTAITILVFKDTLLGFIANIQLTTTDMVRIGDWIEMPSYGADGDVIDVSIHAVRVQNWDKTITTIPPYALISNSFKNWRGMSESGGRRIKRAINIDLSSIRFITDKEITELEKIKLLEPYLRPRQKEIEEYNERHGLGDESPLNGRRQTNIGVYRAYVQQYLRQHPKVHRNMTFLVRQLAPSATGLPLEIYVFSKDQEWVNYEAIQADIFDHLLAALPHFGLRVFQSPSGFDFRMAMAGLGDTNM